MTLRWLPFGPRYKRRLLTKGMWNVIAKVPLNSHSPIELFKIFSQFRFISYIVNITLSQEHLFLYPSKSSNSNYKPCQSRYTHQYVCYYCLSQITNFLVNPVKWKVILILWRKGIGLIFTNLEIWTIRKLCWVCA